MLCNRLQQHKVLQEQQWALSRNDWATCTVDSPFDADNDALVTKHLPGLWSFNKRLIVVCVEPNTTTSPYHTEPTTCSAHSTRKQKESHTRQTNWERSRDWWTKQPRRGKETTNNHCLKLKSTDQESPWRTGRTS